MLATLVHINNLLNATTLGIVSGLALGVALMRLGLLKSLPGHTSQDVSAKETAQDEQTMLITFLYCFFGPLLYQGLLLISLHLAQPFDIPDSESETTRLPG